MGRSIGHDEYEREAVQDIDARGRVRVVAGGVTVSFGREPSPGEVAAFLAAHAPTEVWEARQAELAAALAAREAEIAALVASREAEVEALVAARAPPGTSTRIVEAERTKAREQVREAIEADLRDAAGVTDARTVREVVERELRTARRAGRTQRESRGELRPLRPLTLAELRADVGGRER